MAQSSLTTADKPYLAFKIVRALLPNKAHMLNAHSNCLEVDIFFPLSGQKCPPTLSLASDEMWRVLLETAEEKLWMLSHVERTCCCTKYNFTMAVRNLWIKHQINNTAT